MNGRGGLAPLRLVIVNHMHPSVPHVSGMRAWHFASELATRGHQVVLICERTERVHSPSSPVELEVLLGVHDWRTPFVLGVKPRPSGVLERVRSPRTRPLIRKLLVVWSYVLNSGMFSDFSRGAEPGLIVVATVFRPHVVWGIFGNTDCWLIAQRLARLAGCAWVGDMKDAWDEWMPRGLRTLVARRFSNMAAGTANAEFHADVMVRWFPVPPTVVYSGVATDFIQDQPPAGERFRVTLVGTTYDARNLTRFIRAFFDWVREIPPDQRERITLCYAGSDSVSVAAEVAGFEPVVHLDIRSQLPTQEFAALCRESAVNAYVWSPTTFHHKVVELLACQRPVLSFPGERAESLKLAGLAGGNLMVCADEEQVQVALRRVWNQEVRPPTGSELSQLTWAERSGLLEAVLRRAAGPGVACAH